MSTADKPLSRVQLKVLAQLAKAAWDKLPAAEKQRITDAASEAANDPFGLSETKACEYWRKQEQLRVTGHESMSLMTQRDYVKMRGQWQFLAGEYTAPVKAVLGELTEDARRLRHLVREACAENGHAFPAYPAAICRRQYRCELDDASAEQLTTLLITVKNRKRKETK